MPEDKLAELDKSFRKCHNTMYELLASFELLSSLLRKSNLLSKDFAVFLEYLYYKRDELDSLHRKTFLGKS